MAMVMRRAAKIFAPSFAVVLLFAVFALEARAEDPQPPSLATPQITSSTWYVSAVVSGRAGYRVTHYWSKGTSLRTQTMVGLHPVTTIVRGDRYWVYDELLRKGIAIKRSAGAVAEDAKGQRPFGNDLEGLIRSNGETVGGLTGPLRGRRLSQPGTARARGVVVAMCRLSCCVVSMACGR